MKPKITTQSLVNLTSLLLMGSMTATVRAEISANLGITPFYTDDVALFSVTRRLSLKEDPTQPSVDRPEQGGDFVYEPNAELEWKGDNAWGEMSLALDAGGYIFQNQTAFTHGLYELQRMRSTTPRRQDATTMI